MKKLITMTLCLFLIYLTIQAALLFFRGGHEIEYIIEQDDQVYNIVEHFITDEVPHYFFVVTVEDEVFYFQTFYDFFRAEQVMKELVYLETDNAKCILPTFLFEQILSDFICHYDDQVYNYMDISGLDEDLDYLVRTVDIYNRDNYRDHSTNILSEDYIDVHVDNIIDRHYFYISNYRGVITINENNLRKIAHVNLFRNDVYKMSLQQMVGNYVLMANYNQDVEFNSFRAVNVTNNFIIDINANREISHNSYFQGVADNHAFLYDRENKIQYQINVDNGTVVEVGNVDLGMRVYSDGEWHWVDINLLEGEEYYFKRNNHFEKEGYEKAVQTLAEGGYLYYFMKNDDGYAVYQSFSQAPHYKRFLFLVNSLDDVIIHHDYIYYRDGIYVRYYHDAYGIRTLLRNQEFQFNDEIAFDVFIRRGF